MQKLAERGLAQSTVRSTLRHGERIRDYPDDKPLTSALFLSYDGGNPLHVVAAFDAITGRAFIITADEPSLEFFEPDYRTRRK